MIEKTFQVKDMHCPACVMRIEGLEDDLPGIIHVAASYQKQRILLRYDPEMIGEDEIIAALANLGYHAQPG